MDAFRKAGPIVLEPIVHVEITAPSSSIGDITGDLATKRARINGNNALPGHRATVSALVPLAEVRSAAVALATEIAQSGPVAVQSTRETVRRGRDRLRDAPPVG